MEQPGRSWRTSFPTRPIYVVLVQESINLLLCDTLSSGTSIGLSAPVRLFRFLLSCRSLLNVIIPGTRQPETTSLNNFGVSSTSSSKKSRNTKHHHHVYYEDLRNTRPWRRRPATTTRELYLPSTSWRYASTTRLAANICRELQR